jgi:hypothetical protein
MDLIEQFETYAHLYKTKSKTQEGFGGSGSLTSEEIEKLKDDIKNNQNFLATILNDTIFLKRDYDKSYLHLTHNNIMLTIYTVVIIILIIVILIINPIKF